MIKITGKGLRVLKFFHLLGILCWVGGSICALGLLLYSHWVIPNKESLLYLFTILEFLDYSIIISGALATVIIGAVYSVFTHWGFIKTRWVAVKWLLSLFIIITGSLLYLPWVEQMRQIIGDQGLAAIDSVAYQGLYQNLLLLLLTHLFLYVLMAFLSSWKPKLGRKPVLHKKKNIA